GDTAAEIAALMFRQSASPELVSTERVPLPDASRRPIVVAAGIDPPSPDLGKLLLAHANAGATLVVDGGDASSWWKRPASSRIGAFTRWAPAVFWFTRRRLSTPAISPWTFSIWPRSAGLSACGMPPPSSPWPRKRARAPI